MTTHTDMKQKQSQPNLDMFWFLWQILGALFILPAAYLLLSSTPFLASGTQMAEFVKLVVLTILALGVIWALGRPLVFRNQE